MEITKFERCNFAPKLGVLLCFLFTNKTILNYVSKINLNVLTKFHQKNCNDVRRSPAYIHPFFDEKYLVIYTFNLDKSKNLNLNRSS